VHARRSAAEVPKLGHCWTLADLHTSLLHSRSAYVYHCWSWVTLVFSQQVITAQAAHLDPKPNAYPNSDPLSLTLTLTHPRAGSFQEPPPDMESIMSPATLAAYPSAAAAVDAVVADDLLRQALRVRWIALIGLGSKSGLG